MREFNVWLVACSTSEELQATLAELADLQSQLADAHADNERLADEKQVLLESLCRQTEKLEDSRTKVSFFSFRFLHLVPKKYSVLKNHYLVFFLCGR